MGEEYPLLFNRANAGNLRIMRDRISGRVVAHVGLCFQTIMIFGAKIPVVEVGAVYTLPNFRGQGLATKLMHDAVAHSRRSGAALMLVSGGRGLYRRLDCVDTGKFWRYRVDRPSSLTMVRFGALSRSVKIRRATERDLPTLVAMYRREPVRFVRPMRDARRLWKADRLMNAKCWFWIVERNREPVAYLGHTSMWEGKTKPKRVLPVLEIAGDRNGVAAALPHLFSHTEADALSVIGYGYDEELAGALKKYPREPQEFWGTVKVLDAARLTRCLRGRFLRAMKVRAGADWVEYRLGTETVSLIGASDVTRGVFGGRGGEEDCHWPPTMLRGIFPIPLVWYGWNYI